MVSPVIMLEFNELSPELMERFISEGRLPAFERLRRESVVCVSDAEETPPLLEPWIQWVTVHTGKPYAEHKVFDLADGPKYRAARLWDLVSDAGETVWVCGSMNGAILGEKLNGMVLPDPWSSGLDPYPAAHFEPYYHLVRSYVQEHASGRPPVGPPDVFKFGRFMMEHGLSWQTVVQVLRQLMSESLGGQRWKRATILDRLQWDLFRNVYQKIRPTFSTFFLNSTAHYQHYYWREMEPDRFSIRPSAERIAQHADAIEFGYRRMDALVGECLDMAGPDATIVLVTALSQQPLVSYDDQGGKQVFRARDIDQLLKFAGFRDAYRYAPVMAEEFKLHLETEHAAAAAARGLEGLRLEDGRPVMRVRQSGSEIFAGCQIIQPPPASTRVASAGANDVRLFDQLFYPLEGLKSGCHHPDGILWWRTPSRVHRQVDRRVSLREIAPTVLSLCGIQSSARFDFPPMAEVVEPTSPPAVLAA